MCNLVLLIWVNPFKKVELNRYYIIIVEMLCLDDNTFHDKNNMIIVRQVHKPAPPLEGTSQWLTLQNYSNIEFYVCTYYEFNS